MHPAVHQLPTHLKDKQIARYQSTAEGAASTIVKESQTKLTAFFIDACNCPTTRELGSTLKYEDFPLKFVHDTTGSFKFELGHLSRLFARLWVT